VRILYLANIPSPFTTDIVIEASKQLSSDIKLVFSEATQKGREHWNVKYEGVILGTKPQKEFIKILDEYQPSLVIFTQYNSGLTFWGRRWCFKNNIPFILGPHELISPYDTSIFKFYLKKKWYQYIAKNASGIATMGNNGVKTIAKLYNGAVVSIPYGFDLNFFEYIRSKKIEDEIVFLYSGRLIPFRNPVMTIEIFAELCHNNPEKKLKLIMSGSGALKDACLKTIENQNIENKVEWIVDFKDWYEILTIYGKAHILLALQQYGTWGLPIQEAMAAGMSVVSTNTIEAADNLIIDGYNGYLLPLNKSLILETLQYLVDNPEIIASHQERNLEIVKRVDLPELSNKLAKFIQSVLP
jgi:glycosyltransferase involved in cell wall biosynthesis